MISRRGLFRRFAQAGAALVVAAVLPKPDLPVYGLVFRHPKIELINYWPAASTEIIWLAPKAPYLGTFNP